MKAYSMGRTGGGKKGRYSIKKPGKAPGAAVRPRAVPGGGVQGTFKKPGTNPGAGVRPRAVPGRG
jgi:hypothetical protein